jgi:hypothetical protein
VAAIFALAALAFSGFANSSNTAPQWVNADNPQTSRLHKNNQWPIHVAINENGVADTALDLQPAPEPDLRPAPELDREPAPEPDPETAPEPDPEFDPETAPEPELESSVAAPADSESKAPVAAKSLSHESNKILSILEPRVAILIQHDSNVFLRSHDDKSEQLGIVRPGLHYRRQRRKSVTDISYLLEAGKYFDTGSENYTDHHLDGEWTLNVDRRRKFKVQGRYVKSHVRRYLTRTDEFREALVGNSSEFEDMQMGLGYAVGTYLDRSRMEFRGSTQSIRLDESGPNISRSDRDVHSLTYGHFWNLKRRFAVFVEGQYRIFDYKEQLRDSTQARIVIGSEVRLRKRISGAIRFGQEKKEYDRLNSLRDDYNDTVWDVALTWRPRPNTTFELKSVKGLIEVEQSGIAFRGIYAIRKGLEIDWKQAWRPRLSTFATMRFYQDDVQGTEREDRLKWLHVGATYEVMQKLNISIDGAYESRKFDSLPDVDRTMLTLKAEYFF